MSVGTSLQNLRRMLRAELDDSLTISLSNDRVDIILAAQQDFLTSQYDWAYLNTKAGDFDVNLVAGTRYYTIPATLNLNRPFKVYTNFSSTWQRVEEGITVNDYNVFDSDADERQDPVQKWRQLATQFEVWPLPSQEGLSIRFEGQRKPNALEANGSICELDDLMLVLFSAAVMEKGQKQEQLIVRARERLMRVRTEQPHNEQPIDLSVHGPVQRQKNVGLRIVA